MNETDLDKLIAKEDKDIEEGLDDDDLQSSVDIEEFERKLRNAKNFKDLANSDSDDDLPGSPKNSRPISAPNNKNNKQVKFMMNDSRDLMSLINNGQKNTSNTTQKKTVQQLQTELSKVKQDARPKSEEEKVMDLIGTKNETAKDKKLKELVQKNKELYVSYEKEKTQRQRLEKELVKIKEETELQLNAMEGKVPKNATTKNGEEVDWKKKYTALEKTLQEERVKTTTLKNDLNKTLRIISREIGENFDIDQILTEENSWKGRAQQIEVLKAKVKDLQAKLGDSVNNSRMSNTQSDFDNVSMRTSGTVGGKAKERREEIETLKQLVENLKNDNDTLSEKAKAANARKAILEKEIKEIKNEYEKNKKILIEKSENDDRFITALKKELEKVKATPPNYQTRIVYRDKPVEVRKENDEGESDTTSKKEILFLQSELDKKEKIIKELINEKLKKENVSSTTTTSTGNGMSIGSINKENQTDREKMMRLEAINRALKQENDDLITQKFGVNANSADGKLIKELSAENAKLRRKIDDLQQQLNPKK